MKKLRLGFLTLVLVATAVSCTLFYLQREPSYGKRNLSEWLMDLDDNSVATQESASLAIRHIGPEAVPYLLDWIKPPKEPPRLMVRVVEITYKILARMGFAIEPQEEPGLSDEAVRAFKILGPAGKSAIPELSKLLMQDADYGQSAAKCLSGIGFDAFPALTNALTSTNVRVRSSAVNAMYDFGVKAQSAAPLIHSLIQDPDPDRSIQAILVLGGMGPGALPYAPEFNAMIQTNFRPMAAAIVLKELGLADQVLRCLTNSSPLARWNCTKALKITSDYISHNAASRYGRMMNNIDAEGLEKGNRSALSALNEATILVLTGYLKSTNAIERAQAAEELGSLGSKTFSASPELSSLALNDDVENVRKCAAEALKKMDVQFRDNGIVRGPRRQKQIALEFTGHTFAEGGETILDELAKHHAKASFFLTGDFLRNPDFRPLVKRIIKECHYVGPHSDKHLLFCSWDAPKKTLVSQNEFITDLHRNIEFIYKAGLPQPDIRFFLPAYEHYNAEIGQWTSDEQLTLVNYTPGTRSNADYTQESDKNFVSSQIIFDSIMKREREDPDGLNGFLLLMHLGAGPGRKDKMHARFGELLDALSAKGYQFVRIDELLDGKED